MSAAVVPAERHAEIVALLPRAQFWAQQLWRRLPGLTWQDMTQEAALALCRASVRYDATRATFKTYTGQRIPGAMQDMPELNQDVVPLSLDLMLERAESDEPFGHRSTLAADETPSPEEATCRARVQRWVWAHLAQLPPQWRDVMVLYYYEDMTMKAIGRRLGVTESRVSQIHRAALARLRQRLAPYREELTHA